MDMDMDNLNLRVLEPAPFEDIAVPDRSLLVQRLLIRGLRLSPVSLYHGAVTLRLRVSSVWKSLGRGRRIRSVNIILTLDVRLSCNVRCRESRLASGRVHPVGTRSVYLPETRAVRWPFHFLWKTVTAQMKMEREKLIDKHICRQAGTLFVNPLRPDGSGSGLKVRVRVLFKNIISTPGVPP